MNNIFWNYLNINVHVSRNMFPVFPVTILIIPFTVKVVVVVQLLSTVIALPIIVVCQRGWTNTTIKRLCDNDIILFRLAGCCSLQIFYSFINRALKL